MKTYPRTNDFQTIYLNTVITNPNILDGDYTIYNEFVNDPTQFEKNNHLFHRLWSEIPFQQCQPYIRLPV